MTKAIYAATSDYVDELKSLHEKRRFSVSGILKRLGVSRSGYLAWKKHIPSIYMRNHPTMTIKSITQKE